MAHDLCVLLQAPEQTVALLLEIRRVTSDSRISYHGMPYSVDPSAVGKTVTVRPSGENVGDPFEVYIGCSIGQRGLVTERLP